MIITLSGMIGSGKSTLTTILSDYLGTPAYYESVTDNPILKLFYKDPNRYAFLLQVYFLNTRFSSMKQALKTNNSIMDRSIYEDSLFFHTNASLGRVGVGDDSKNQVSVYDNLLENMLEEIKGMPKKSPDLMIGIKVSYETMIKRINLRGREFEQPKNDPGLVSYYNRLLDEYDKFFNGGYNASPILIIDGDKYDFVDNEEDREEVLNQISDKLKSMGLLDSSFIGKEYSRNQVDNMLDKVQSVIV